ncbi:RGD1561251 (predicted) [Rattus norvegicus]|uniref:RGD1561251 (Predicted) n=1 Tax=Rattus norvegicus TaxID=10116 RepID=A6I185_RAT|nr:RGD1561251 (predicted) [Rattus norvegicus]
MEEVVRVWGFHEMSLSGVTPLAREDNTGTLLSESESSRCRCCYHLAWGFLLLGCLESTIAKGTEEREKSYIYMFEHRFDP